ncbi:hypothetical protein BDV97DRAFT_194706 [Delphinella strobiligena]|nr:hypothetical protein BDV97DRAFT_194706 [Delphinella strobiligena]
MHTSQMPSKPLLFIYLPQQQYTRKEHQHKTATMINRKPAPSIPSLPSYTEACLTDPPTPNPNPSPNQPTNHLTPTTPTTAKRLLRPDEKSLWTKQTKNYHIRAQTRSGHYAEPNHHNLTRSTFHFQHGISEPDPDNGTDATDPSACYPELYFTCKIQPRNPPPRRRSFRQQLVAKLTDGYTLNDGYTDKKNILDLCKRAVEVLAAHRAVEGCSCDFEDLSMRERRVGTGAYTRIFEGREGRRKCKRFWWRGACLRGVMERHDELCVCGCFGVVI